jgi:hypothetical protein
MEKRMSLEKGIYHGKEKRKPYYDSRRFDWSCKQHGGCAWCYSNRKGKDLTRLREWTRAQIEEIERS